MKNILLISLIILISSVFYSFIPIQDSIQMKTIRTISDSEKQSLRYMLDEEKLAHDIYVEMYSKWSLMPFSNISKSEEFHMELVKNLLDSFNVEYEYFDAPGKFANKDIQKLYDRLKQKGNVSVENAIIVGATIEELDISDIEKYLLKVESPEIKSAYNILVMGSKNHLRAFNRNIISHNINYEPQYLDLEYYNEIISSSNQCCGKCSKKKCNKK